MHARAIMRIWLAVCANSHNDTCPSDALMIWLVFLVIRRTRRFVVGWFYVREFARPARRRGPAAELAALRQIRMWALIGRAVFCDTGGIFSASLLEALEYIINRENVRDYYPFETEFISSPIFILCLSIYNIYIKPSFSVHSAQDN